MSDKDKILAAGETAGIAIINKLLNGTNWLNLYESIIVCPEHIITVPNKNNDLNTLDDTLVLFNVRWLKVSSSCQNNNGSWHDFFLKVLDLEKYYDQYDTHPKTGNNWYSANNPFSDPELEQKNEGGFKISVPLLGVLKALKIGSEKYNKIVTDAENVKAEELGCNMDDDRQAHSLEGLKVPNFPSRVFRRVMKGFGLGN